MQFSLCVLLVSITLDHIVHIKGAFIIYEVGGLARMRGAMIKPVEEEEGEAGKLSKKRTQSYAPLHKHLLTVVLYILCCWC